MSSGRSRCVATLTAGVVGLGLAALPGTPAEGVPTLRATTVVDGLAVPWDLTWVGDRMLYTLRSGEVWAKAGSSAPRRVADLRAETYANGEGGLLGIVADPAAASNRLFYTCGTHASGGNPVDVRVRRWQLNTAGTSAASVADVVRGLPLGSGRHSGCRLRFGADGKLYVGTGDAAVGTHPQNLNSLGGKVLRVDPTASYPNSAPADNPFYSRGGDARYVWTYGHRNIQGLALRPGTSELYSAEHGPARDDEVNRIVGSGNYGWDPVPGYNESVPMTDTRQFPSARRALWSSGSPTVATGGVTFLEGPAWGRWQGALAVAHLKDQGINILTLNPGGGLARVEAVPAAEGYRRIRTVQLGPDGALYFTTSNGSNDRIVRLSPSPERPLPTYRPGLDVSPVGLAAARTGTSIYLFVRSDGDRVYYKRSRDNGATWSGWVNTGVQSTSAPAATSSAAGRIDLITRSATNTAVHTWFVDGARVGQASLGGIITAAPAATSLADGTLDVFVRGSGDYAGWRKRYASGTWSRWQRLDGVFTSALGAAADRTSGTITVTGRSTGGFAHERTVTPTSNGTSWPRIGGPIWSARALGDRVGSTRVGVTTGSDGNPVVDRGRLVMGVNALYTSAPAVVTRSDGTWIMFGRSTDGSAWAYDARPGGYRNFSLGGILR